MKIQQELDGAQALIKTLDDLGIEHMSSATPARSGPPHLRRPRDCSRANIKFVSSVRHEQGAVPHGRRLLPAPLAGPPAVLVTSGPGAGNTVTGLMTAHMDSVPMIVITGQQVTWMLGKDAFQEADVFGITYPGGEAQLPRPRAPTISSRGSRSEAHHIATHRPPRPGPHRRPEKHLPGPLRPATWIPTSTLPGYQPETGLRDFALHAVDRGGPAPRSGPATTVILAGQGCMIARAADTSFSISPTTLGCPVTSVLCWAKVSSRRPTDLALGMLGMHGTAYANKAVVRMLISSSSSAPAFDDRIIGQADKFGAHAKIIHIDIDPC